MAKFNLKKFIPTIITLNQRNNISKQLLELKSELSIRPRLTEIGVYGQGTRAVRPNVGAYKSLQTIARDSAIITTIKNSLKTEIFRNGWEFKPKFVTKDIKTGEELEYEPEDERNPETGNPVRKPNPVEIIELEKKFQLAVNKNGESLITVLEQLEDDLQDVDDAFLYISKEYIFNDQGQVIGAQPIEIMRLDPAHVEILADKFGDLGKEEDGTPIYIDPDNRGSASKNSVDPATGRQNLPAHYKIGYTETDMYFVAGEVIHISKYRPSLLYGTSNLYSLYDKVMTLRHMDHYFRVTYEHGRPPKGLFVVNTKNQESLNKAWKTLLSENAQNPNATYPLAVENPGTGPVAEFIDIMKTPDEMQLVEFRNELRRSIGAQYGVMPLFHADLSQSGGLNNEGLQVTVTNRAIEKSHRIWNDTVFPVLMKNFAVNDYELCLLPNEEQDEMADLQLEHQRIINAEAMQRMGFEIKKLPSGEFQFSEEVVNPPMQEASGFGGLFPEEDLSPAGSPLELSKRAPSTPEETMSEVEAEGERMFGKKFMRMLKKINKNKNFRDKAARASAIGGLTLFLRKEFEKVANTLIRDGYKAGLDEVGKVLKTKVGFTTIDTNRVDVLQNSDVLRDAYSNMSASVSKKINSIMDKGLQEGKSYESLIKEMREQVGEERYRIERIARTEANHVTNLARESAYKRIDPEGNGLYKWIGPNDQRTTSVSKRIKKRTNKGVPLEELKEIVREESIKFAQEKKMKNWQPRDFVSHINSRHSFVRVN